MPSLAVPHNGVAAYPHFGGRGLEIVIKELRQLRMSADFFANTSHDISRYPGV